MKRHFQYMLKKTGLFLCVILIVAFCSINRSSFQKMKSCSIKVAVSSQSDETRADRITLRGLYIDDEWINPETVYKSGNWSFDEKDHIFTSIDDSPLILSLPIAQKILLIFNYGPDFGLAKIECEKNTFTFDCFSAEPMENGQSFCLPLDQINLESKIIFARLAAFIISVLAVFLCIVLALIYNRLKSNISWRIAEKIFLALLLPLALIFLYYFSVSSTPRVSEMAYYWGEDASNYTLLGKTCAQGAIPYVDIWEQKGPVIYLIYTVGYLLSPVWGVFAIQIVALWISLAFAYYIGKAIADEPIGVLASLITFAFYVLVMDEGALIEIFNLPFLMASTYFAVKHMQNYQANPSLPLKYAFFYGLTCGVSLGLRVTNCVAVCCFFAYAIFLLLRKKMFSYMIKTILSFLLGVLCVVLPFVIYFSFHNALYDLLYGTILFSLEYTKTAINSVRTIEEWRRIAIYFLPAFACLVLSLEQEKHMRICVSLSAVVASVMLSKLFPFPHYYIILLPFATIATSWLFQNHYTFAMGIDRYKASYICVVTLLSCILIPKISETAQGYYNWVNALHFTKEESAYVTAIKKQCAIINAEGAGPTIGYNVRPDWYLIADTSPCFKYFTAQDWLNEMSSRYLIENVNFYKSLYAKWIVVQDDVLQADIASVLENNYILFDSEYIEDRNVYLNLYGLKTSNSSNFENTYR